MFNLWSREAKAPEGQPRFDVLADELAGLRNRVRDLESERLALMTEWVKTRDQVLRFMKRAGALRASSSPAVRFEQTQDDEDQFDLVTDDEVDEIRMKYGQR